MTTTKAQVSMIGHARSSRIAGLVLLLLAVTAAGCHHRTETLTPQGLLEADKYLYERGQELLARKKWYQAREHFRKIVENYPQSSYRPDAKLGLGDTYIGENSTESLILAQNEFKEFLTFYPTHERADYAQFRLGYSHYRQLQAPDRDQTETRDTVLEWETFMTRYPSSRLKGEVAPLLRKAKDRLGDAEYKVGSFYWKVKWYPGAIERFKELLTTDPQYSRRDAVYYLMADAFAAIGRPAEALPYFEKVGQEFQESDYLDRSKKRAAKLKEEIEKAVKQ
jgi:outer membrane protein assembly factor BamD